MADYALSSDGLVPAEALMLRAPLDTSNVERALGLNLWTVGRGYSSAVVLTLYKMRGMDAVIDGLFDTWMAESTPDIDASEYKGPLAKPLREVMVVDTWSQ